MDEMNVSEAISYLNNIKEIKITHYPAENAESIIEPQSKAIQEVQALDCALQALRRQTSVKPTKSESGTYYICPNCNRFIERNEHSHGNIDIPYCKWCGQAFDWE